MSTEESASRVLSSVDLALPELRQRAKTSHPTLKTGVEAMVVAALTWLAR